MKPRALLLCAAIAAAAVLLLARWYAPRPPASQPPTVRTPAAAEAPAVATPGQLERAPAAPAADPDAAVAAQGLTGRIVDRRESPIRGAQVFVFATAAHDPFALAALAARGVIEPPLGQAIAAADGSFRLPLPAEATGARIELRAIDADHADATVANLELVKAQWRELGAVVLTDGCLVRGTVRDRASDAPLAGAEVTLQPQGQVGAVASTPGRERGRVAVTDGLGEYRFEHVAPGPCTLRASAADHACGELAQQPVQDNDENVFDFDLPAGAAIGGLVTDARGTPLAGAMVRASALAAPAQPLQRARTAADGRFELDGLVEGEYRLTAAAVGCQETTLEPVATPRRDVVLVLPPQGAVRLRVRDGAGAPVTSFSVQARRWELADAQPAFTAAGARVTPADLHDGAFLLPGLDPGSYKLEVAATGFAKVLSEAFTIDEAALVQDVAVTLGAGGTITGRLARWDGAPLAGARLELLPAGIDGGATQQLFQPLLLLGATTASATSDQDGAFAFAHVVPGTYQLRCSHDDAAARTVRGVAVAEARASELGAVTLARGTQLMGSVRLGDQPLGGARVQVLALQSADLGRGFVGETRSDAQGRWALPRRLPPGRFQIVASRSDRANPFLEAADQTQSRLDIDLAGEDQRSVALAIGDAPAERR